MSVTLRVRVGQRNIQVSELKLTDPLSHLTSYLAKESNIPVGSQQLLGGYPPKPISLSNQSASLESIGIKNGDQLILNQVGAQIGIVKGVERGPYIPPSDKKGYFVRRIQPGDNSCLFHSLSYVLKALHKGQNLRQLVANIIAENPKKYDAVFLGMSNTQYVNWIMQKDHWGGAIEIRIISDYFKTEICAFDTQTCREDHYGEDLDYTTRALIIYTGSHYDALALAEHGGANDAHDQVLFSASDKSVMEKARAYVKEEHERWLKKK